MKIINKNNRKIKTLILAFFITTVGFTIYQSTLVQKEKQLIIGTWIINGEPENKWVFSSNQCERIIDSETLGTYNYTIDSDFSPSGLEHTYLKLVNVLNSDETIEFVINSLGNDKMTLETFPPKIDYIHFTKQ